MSVGRNLQEMENVVTKGAAPAEAPHKSATPVVAPGQTGAWEDLGGPTPENYRPDDDSAALKAPTLAQVKNVVNAKAAAAEGPHTSATPVSAPGQGVKEETEEEEELVDEVEVDEVEVDEEEEVVAEANYEGGENEMTHDKGKNGEKNGKKGMKASSSPEEECKEEVETEDEFNIEEDVNALLEGEELSEEFQEKARTIFEAAIKTKVAEIKESLQASYEQSLVEEIEAIKEGLIDRVDAYLEYVADEWISENALAVEHGLKTEMTESFLSGMKQLFEDHYVTIPEDRYDVIESMVDKLDEMEAKLNEQIERNVALNRRLAESVADVIFADVAEGLALSQKDKLASLAENVEFDSEESYREKLVTLRESYFPSNAGTQRSKTENLSEEVVSHETAESVSPRMQAYLETLSRASKK